jgi:16S rRNA (cytidine1402-2'-O)-methyltransferase
MKLYIVATPIGNLSDITLRAIETLKEVDFIAAEDTRRTRILLNHLGIEKQIVSFHAKSSFTKAANIISKISKSQNGGAYVSDAGTPAISDPGFRLVQEALSKKICVVPIPGASAITTLVSASGAPANQFFFAGFLPHKKGRQTFFKKLAESETTTIFYESVHRFQKCLNELALYCGETRTIVVGRELTKMHEEIFRGTVAQAFELFTTENTRGEFTIIVAPKNFTF